MKTFREIAEMHYASEPSNEFDKEYRENRINALEKLLTEQLRVHAVAEQMEEVNKGHYTLYHYHDVPLPIYVTGIYSDEVEFECFYSRGNKHEWEEEFIGTEMEGLVYDPFQGWFELKAIEKVDGDKIYLTNDYM